MQEADIDHRDFQPSEQQRQRDKNLVKFEIRIKENPAETLKQGKPVFREVEYIDIKVPGNRSGGACRPATFRDKKDYPRHYDMFKQRIEMPLDGTPLAEWPQMSRKQVEEMAYYNVKTVEQLVDMSDTNASKFMGIRALQTKAKAWLEHTTETAKIAEIATLKSENATLKEQVEGLLSRFDKMDKAAEAIEEAATIKPAPKKAKTASKKAKV